MNCSHQAPLSMEFSRQEYWSGLPCPSPVDLPTLGIKLRSSAFQAGSLPFEKPLPNGGNHLGPGLTCTHPESINPILETLQ